MQSTTSIQSTEKSPQNKTQFFAEKAKRLCVLFCSARHHFYGFYVTFFVANAQTAHYFFKKI
jgi:hypothetical protein